MIINKYQSEHNKKTILENNVFKSQYNSNGKENDLDKDSNYQTTASATLSKNEWPLIKKLNTLRSLNTAEVDMLIKLHDKKIVIGAHTTFLNQETFHNKCFIVNSGWAFSFKDHYNGERKVINYYLPGDIVSPFALVNTQKKYSVASITNMQVSVFDPEYLVGLYTVQPKLVLLYMDILSREDDMLIEQMTCMGWLTAYQRTVYLLLSLYKRLNLVGLVRDNTFYAPFTQQLLADTLNMSIVHMNRTLKKLRDNHLIKIESNNIKLLDTDRLKQITEY